MGIYEQKITDRFDVAISCEILTKQNFFRTYVATVRRKLKISPNAINKITSILMMVGSKTSIDRRIRLLVAILLKDGPSEVLRHISTNPNSNITPTHPERTRPTTIQDAVINRRRI